MPTIKVSRDETLAKREWVKEADFFEPVKRNCPCCKQRFWADKALYVNGWGDMAHLYHCRACGHGDHVDLPTDRRYVAYIAR